MINFLSLFTRFLPFLLYITHSKVKFALDILWIHRKFYLPIYHFFNEFCKTTMAIFTLYQEVVNFHPKYAPFIAYISIRKKNSCLRPDLISSVQ